ncbi:hypothetical protein DJ70_15780 [Halorubrum halodurans]|uniref:Uncharacterized protein n=1 Tax=Halorubrum halodurans TaxID=1383851 RepID=A0A256IC03_9EURY|nr:hypothetical protein DJ70_15780 [Halorubrum halodurans]
MTRRTRSEQGQTTREALEMHLAQALTRCESAVVRAHLEAALRKCRDLPPTPLVECPVCGRVGLPERIQAHDCPGTTRD